MYWLIGIAFIFVLAFIIIKLTLNTKESPDSKLGIFEHPSTFEKQEIEMVDKSLKSDSISTSKENKKN